MATRPITSSSLGTGSCPQTQEEPFSFVLWMERKIIAQIPGWMPTWVATIIRLIFNLPFPVPLSRIQRLPKELQLHTLSFLLPSSGFYHRERSILAFLRTSKDLNQLQIELAGRNKDAPDTLLQDVQYDFRALPFAFREKLKKQGKEAQSLCFSRSTMTQEKMVQLISVFPKLGEIHFTLSSIASNGLKSAFQFRHLHSLCFTDSTINDEQLELVALQKGVTSLALKRCNEVTDKGFAGFIMLSDKKLTSLQLANCSKITTKTLKTLKALVRLETLMLEDYPNVTNVHAIYLAQIPRLRSLFVTNCPRFTSVGAYFSKKNSACTVVFE